MIFIRGALLLAVRGQERQAVRPFHTLDQKELSEKFAVASERSMEYDFHMAKEASVCRPFSLRRKPWVPRATFGKETIIEFYTSIT